MQSWGNDPRRWATGPRSSTCSIASPSTRPRWRRRPQTAERCSETSSIASTSCSGCRKRRSTPRRRSARSSSIRSRSKARVIGSLAVDGRTKRRFPSRTSQAGGIDYEGATGPGSTTICPRVCPARRRPASSATRRWPLRCRRAPRATPSSRLSSPASRSSAPRGWSWRSCPFQRLARLLGEVDAEAWCVRTVHLRSAARRARALRIGGGAVGRPPHRLQRGARLLEPPDGDPVAHRAHRAARVERADQGLGRPVASAARSCAHARRLRIGDQPRAAARRARRLGHAVPHGAHAAAECWARWSTHPERAHPFYRARLKMRAPVVPTHGWPAGHAGSPRAELGVARRDGARRPAGDARRRRASSIAGLRSNCRANPVDPNMIGWHAKAARRMAFGRVFAGQPQRRHRHVPPPTGSTGRSVTCSPASCRRCRTPVPSRSGCSRSSSIGSPSRRWCRRAGKTTAEDRRRWRVGRGHDRAAVQLLVDVLPRIWQGAADSAGRLEDLPPSSTR